MKILMSFFNNLKIFFRSINNEKFLFDLRGFINKEILNQDIRNIENIEIYRKL